MLNSESLRIFVAVARHGSLSRAAAALRISQPAVSVRIKSLESAVNAKLFVRTKKGVQLTKAGARLLSEADPLLAALKNIPLKILAQTRELSGAISIGAYPTLASYVLPKIFHQIRPDLHPIDVRVVTGRSREICDQVIALTVDFGIVVEPLRHPDLTIVPLFDDEVLIWEARSKRKQKQRGAPVIVYDPSVPQIAEVLRKAKGQELFDRYRSVHIPNLHVIADVVASGFGWGVLPRTVALQYHSSRLTPVKNSPVVSNNQVCLIYRHDLIEGALYSFVKKGIVRAWRTVDGRRSLAAKSL